MKTIDTRDLYKRKCELEDLRDAVTTAREELEEAQAAYNENNADEGKEANESEAEELEEAVTTAENNLAAAESDFGDDEKTELDELETLENEISEFKHGETMIPESDFEDYARQLAEDIGAMEGVGDKWPCTCIDWEQAARELAMDYSEVQYQGDTYLVRA